MRHVHADYDVIAEMAASDPDEPVVMLNLLKYRDVAESGHGVDGLTGRQAYTRYGEALSNTQAVHGYVQRPRLQGHCPYTSRGVG